MQEGQERCQSLDLDDDDGDDDRDCGGHVHWSGPSLHRDDDDDDAAADNHSYVVCYDEEHLLRWHD